MSGNSNLETKTFLDELRSLDKGWLFDLGHPLLNRITESFVKGAGIGAMHAVAREAYFTAMDGESPDAVDLTSRRRRKLSELKGENGKNSLEAMVKSTGREAFQWGLAAGVHSGLTYSLREARGTHDWTNSAVAGAITGVALALTGETTSHEMIVQYAITGAAVSTAANLLSGIF